MKVIFILLALMLSACGASKIQPEYGKTTQAELTQIMGVPEKEENIPVVNSKILLYPNGDKYQVTSDIVTTGFITPKTEEISLIYWKHAFKDCDVSFEELKKEKIGHEKSERLMKCDSLGTGVVYREDSSNILRVIKYEKK